MDHKKSTEEMIAYLHGHKIQLYHDIAVRLQELSTPSFPQEPSKWFELLNIMEQFSVDLTITKDRQLAYAWVAKHMKNVDQIEAYKSLKEAGYDG